MPTIDIELECPLHDSFRVRQVAGMFDLPVGQTSVERFSVEIPDSSEPWTIGAIVGPSGSGKTTVARRVFGDSLYQPRQWPGDRAIIDCFGKLPIRRITQTLTAVGFSSPPGWLRPFHVLSTGERFRCELARAVLSAARKRESNANCPLPNGDGRMEGDAAIGNRQSELGILGNPLAAMDEYTSSLDRAVARTCSLALSRALRRGVIQVRFVAVTCHDDVLGWLEPDWVLDMGALGADGIVPLRWGRLRRPPIPLHIRRTTPDAWQLFKRHHYLSAELHPSASCFLATVDGHPAAFAAVLPFPHSRRPGWREHRIVCLPDFQGVGIGSAFSNFVAAIYVSTGKPYFSTTGHPAMIAHRRRSELWRMLRPPGFTRRPGATSGRTTRMPDSCSRGRITASFEYVGRGRQEDARRLGVKPVA